MAGPRLVVREAAKKGRGVFADVPIAKGGRVLTVKGRVVSTANLTADMMALQIGADRWLCSDGSQIDDLINHSCDPNLGFLNGGRVLYATRDIEAGEELAWDYSTSISEPGWELHCLCGTRRCRKIVRSWWQLTAAQRRRLRPMALAYLRE